MKILFDRTEGLDKLIEFFVGKRLFSAKKDGFAPS
jgi:hypothetical protein